MPEFPALRRALADALMARRLDWQGTTSPGFSLQEPDWPQEKVAESLAVTCIEAAKTKPDELLAFALEANGLRILEGHNHDTELCGCGRCDEFVQRRLVPVEREYG